MADRSVVVIPGATYGPAVPQLFLPMIAAVRRGAEPALLEWPPDAVPVPLGEDERVRWVEERVGPVLDELDPVRSVVVGKSLGSCAAGLVASLGLPAVWVTPLLTDTAVHRALEHATAPFLLVGGTADPWWVGDVARSLTPHVLELDGADHGLFLPGPLRRSAENLARLADASERFLDEVVWADGQEKAGAPRPAALPASRRRPP